MRQFKNKSMIELKGFSEFLERVQEAGGNIDTVTRKCFEKASENVYDELQDKARKAGLSERLIEQIEHEEHEKGDQNRWSASVGWKKQKPKSEPLPDTFKVMFYNYGTPKRQTSTGENRGEESPHPEGSHGFIKKAKLAAAAKNKKLFKETLNEIIGGLSE